MALSGFFSPITSRSPLIVLDLANNHNGSVEHGKRVISSVAAAAEGQGLAVAVKFQYRQLDSFIHPEYHERVDLKYVKRFQETRLSEEEFLELVNFAHSLGLQTASTPFDEASVPWVEAHGHSFLKVASASFRDWPLWEAIGESSLPVVASTAGASLSDIDRVVAFLSNRSKEFALMHCVAAYPTPDRELRLGRVELLRSRYPHVPVGYSTHEDPANLVAAPMALALGARILERHVGSSAEGQPVNDYSSEPEALTAWLESVNRAIGMLGTEGDDSGVNPAELKALNDLGRGVYANTSLTAGDRISAEDVLLCIPRQEGQLGAEDLSKYADITAVADREQGAPLFVGDVSVVDRSDALVAITEQVAALLHESGVTIPTGTDLEISHHYGLAQFGAFGMSMLTVVNREYCKKLLILLPGQEHPEQWHKVKEESFFVLHGECTLWLDGIESSITAGDLVIIRPGVRHRMKSSAGCVIEEVSMRHEGTDSYYSDERINGSLDRKTFVKLWSTT